ncbi:MAG: TlpA family protein disulfide reductase [Xanthomonadales bacterium]|nr:TlpA family protein disulfide reductase [Xanthomonadales bacterium]
MAKPGANLWILLAAMLAGGLGLFAGYVFEARPGWLLNSETGQAVLQTAVNTGTRVPDDLLIAERGDPLPDIRLGNLTGGIEPVADAAGRPLLINFWASWCGPCIEEMPALDAFARQQGDNGVQVVGIALDDLDAVKSFLADTPVGYRILLDVASARDSSVQLGNRRGVLPYSVLVDANGIIQRIRLGPFAHGEVEDWAAED